MNVDEYSPVCSFCFTTSYGTRENDAIVFPIAAAEAIDIVRNVSSALAEDGSAY